MNKEWKIGDIVEPREYTDCAIFCNQQGDRHIELVDGEYKVVGNQTHEPTIADRIAALEIQITQRNMRSAILGDEFAINKITQIEAQIAELRKQLENE